MLAARATPQLASGPGLEVSLSDLPQDADVHHLIGHDPLQACVLLLQRLQALQRLDLHPVLLLPPPMVRRLAHLQTTACICDRRPAAHQSVRLTQLPYDLLRLVSLSHPRVLPPVGVVGLSFYPASMPGGRPRAQIAGRFSVEQLADDVAGLYADEIR